VTFIGPQHTELFLDRSVPEEELGLLTAGGQPWDRGGPLVFHSRWWIEGHWGRAFEIEQIESSGFAEPGRAGYAVLRKRVGRHTAEELERPDSSDPRELKALQREVHQLRWELKRIREERDTLEEMHERESELRAKRDRARHEAVTAHKQVRAMKRTRVWRAAMAGRRLYSRLGGNRDR